MRKTAVIFTVCLLMAVALPLTSFAHGHGGAAVNRRYSLCDAENCNTTGLHYHGDICYYGHSIGDGHDYHKLCDVQGCALTGTHEHDGATCFSHYAGDGHSYHNSGHHSGSARHH